MLPATVLGVRSILRWTSETGGAVIPLVVSASTLMVLDLLWEVPDAHAFVVLTI